MYYSISIFIHYLGIGILITSILGGFIVHNSYRKSSNITEQLIFLKILRPIGLLGPIGLGIMLISGIGNLMFLGFASQDVISQRWLMEKLFMFFLVLIIGLYSGIRSKKRATLIEQIISGNENTKIEKQKFDKISNTFLIIQTILLLAILFRSAVK